MATLSLFPDPPEGFTYRPGLIDAAEEQALIARMAALPFQPFEFHDIPGKRRTVSFGWSYRFDGSGPQPADPEPGLAAAGFRRDTARSSRRA